MDVLSKQFTYIYRFGKIYYYTTILAVKYSIAEILFMRGSRGGVGGVRTPLEFAKLNIADIRGN